MTKKHWKENGKNGVDICEEALALLYFAFPRALIAYAAGTVPFLLGFLYFWSDMSRSAFAPFHLIPGSFGLAGLFLWMKCWQTVFAAELQSAIIRDAPPCWSFRRVIRLVAVQSAIQPYGLLLIPLATFLLLPFYTTYTFFQNVTVLGDGSHGGLGDVYRRSRRLSLIWPVQNHVIIWLASPWVFGFGLLCLYGAVSIMTLIEPSILTLSGPGWLLAIVVLGFILLIPLAPIGCAVAGNMTVIFVMLPWLIRALTGKDNIFLTGGMNLVMNSTFLMIIFCVTYLLLDPLAKAAYVIRCFYGDAVRTGEDLRDALRETAEGEAAATTKGLS